MVVDQIAAWHRNEMSDEALVYRILIALIAVGVVGLMAALLLL